MLKLNIEPVYAETSRLGGILFKKELAEPPASVVSAVVADKGDKDEAKKEDGKAADVEPPKMETQVADRNALTLLRKNIVRPAGMKDKE